MLNISATLRKDLGTGNARFLRSKGLVPAVVYGNKKQNIQVSIVAKDIDKLHKKHSFYSTVLELELEGKKYRVLPKAVESHPLTEAVRHVDFVFLNDDFQKVDVFVNFEGRERCIGVKKGGFFNIISRKIRLLCPVNSIPTAISIDVSSFVVGTAIKAKDLKLPKGCSLRMAQEFVIASITGRKSKDNEDKKPTEL